MRDADAGDDDDDANDDVDSVDSRHKENFYIKIKVNGKCDSVVVSNISH